MQSLMTLIIGQNGNMNHGFYDENIKLEIP